MSNLSEDLQDQLANILKVLRMNIPGGTVEWVKNSLDDITEEARQDGYTDGHEEGYTAGCDEGYSAGHSDGYEEGLGHGYSNASAEGA
jgi:flagellar biosynthesis/type III secretory pathway protein FliH